MRLGDFVAGGFPLPASPIYDGARGVGDFVPGGFPLPQTPVYYPSVDGSLPKAPALTQSDLAPLPAADSPCGAGMGCGCASCGMGALTGDTLIPQASLPTFLQGDSYITGFPTVYLAGLAILGAFAFMGGKKGRR